MSVAWQQWQLRGPPPAVISCRCCCAYNPCCSDIGGCKEQIEKMREVVELPMLHPEKFVTLGIDPPKGVLLYGPPGTGK